MRKGSALLIVLGMLAFMVISAVAFSAYMRYSRLPSSFLRRSSASRLLVKAALAEAIDEIDAAIGNNPHPGIGQRQPRMTAGLAATDLGGLNADMRTRNHWRGRVYIGTNQFHSVEDTVSTLTLEGLAYIPPPLVNEARYYSRRSQAGCWRKLGFDSGRYAFCAIDVSDFFDVNSLLADNARSSAPGSRFSLAYLFENAAHTSASGGTGDPAAWDAFMKPFTDDGNVPLISMADWNLAVNQDTPGGMMSQFCQYIRENRTSFYGGIGEQGAAADAIRNQVFVTDSWFPPQESYSTSAGGSAQKVLDLSDERYQPFTKGELSSNRTLFQVIDQTLANEEMFKRLEQCINGLGYCQLYDYLDTDDDPLSLAIPTTERVPMICGLSPNMVSRPFSVEPNVVIDNQISPGAGGAVPGGTYTITLQVKYEIKGLQGNFQPEALLVYPFRHKHPSDSARNYEVGGRMGYFLTVEGGEVGLRTQNAKDVFHDGTTLKDSVNPKTPLKDAFYAVDFTPQTLKPTSFTPENGPAGAIKRMPLRPKTALPDSIPFLEVTYEGQGTYQDDGQGKAIPDPNHSAIDLAKGDKVSDAKCSWAPVDSKGNLSSFVKDLAANLGNPTYATKLKVNFALWASVKNTGTDRYVDLVPACVYDDGDLNGRNTDRSKQYGEEHFGRAYPLMRFDLSGGAEMELKAVNVKAALTAAATAVEATPQTVIVGDPRFNHAPESWFSVSGALNENLWLDNCGCGYKAREENGYRRDGDIFMSVSDNEELQSVYELANLTRFTDFYKPGAVYGSKNLNYDRPENNGKVGLTFAANAADVSNNHVMWRTYDPFGLYLDGGDDFDGTGIVNRGGGFKINPFSNITNVMMAAFANTPHEWRVASANEDTMGSIPETASAFNKDYAWNEYSSGAKIQWLDLEDLAGVFMEETRQRADQIASGSETWEDVWADLGWCDINKSGDEWSKYLLTDMQLGDTSAKGRIWSADRKFLYGYWHDCFAIRQQLFLVFVRAEPAMMGGGARGQTPPQLGARAVALVWRDPTSSNDERTPHRTRILFYRQFD